MAMSWQVVFSIIFLICEISYGEIHYSILEEIKPGSIVGNVANHLNLDIEELSIRKLQLSSQSKIHNFNINEKNGDLYVTGRVDREVICGTEEELCLLDLEILASNPVNVFQVQIEIQDINDNPPKFSKDIFDVTISESALPGNRFVLVKALDPDLGSNSVQMYNISPNHLFTLGEKIITEEIKYPELVLERTLDREKQSTHELILTALDGGKPVKTGSTIIKIVVQDVNDNYPVFGKDLYRINLKEDAPVGFLVLHLNATDEDEGTNALITYSFSQITSMETNIFSLDSKSGDITTIGPLDFEITRNYEMTVEAKDGGGLVAHCTILIQVIDVNDNAPEIVIKSLFTPIPEDSETGTLIALLYVNDLDSGKNGDVTCQIKETLPFKLIISSNSYYKLITTSSMDREATYIYNITIIAKDEGFPPMSAKKTLTLFLSDVNDNPPVFNKPSYIAYVSENNTPGTSIHRVHASDIDDSENAQILYTIPNLRIDNIPVSSYISINLESGVLYAQRSFDYEQLREFEFQVMAKDRGFPPLSSNVTVRICVIDKNDNTPKILYPLPDTEGTSLFEYIPRSSAKGFLVTKVIAVDEDSGHNAWLSYHFLQAPQSSFFIINQHNGEIRIAHDLQDTDSLRDNVIVVVKDNGVPARSATVTINLVVAENFQYVLPTIVNQPNVLDSNVTFYLVISIALISFLFTSTVIITVICKCRKSNISPVFGSLNRPWYPQLSLTYPSEFSDGSLPLPYSYDVCVTLDSRQNEIAFLKPVPNVPTDNLIDTDDSASINDNVPSTSVNQVCCIYY